MTASPLDAALTRVGDRWTLLVVEALLDGPQRFGELSERVAGIAPNILTERLRRLERQGILASEPYSRRPLRMAYRLTEDGQELAGVLRLLAAWGSRDLTDSREDGAEGYALRHGSCGTFLEVRWYCPTCARAVADEEAESLRYA